MRRWPYHMRRSLRDKPAEAPPGMVYGFRKDGSAIDIAVVEKHYREMMEEYDGLPAPLRHAVANSTHGRMPAR